MPHTPWTACRAHVEVGANKICVQPVLAQASRVRARSLNHVHVAVGAVSQDYLQSRSMFLHTTPCIDIAGATYMLVPYGQKDSSVENVPLEQSCMYSAIFIGCSFLMITSSVFDKHHVAWRNACQYDVINYRAFERNLYVMEDTACNLNVFAHMAK